MPARSARPARPILDPNLPSLVPAVPAPTPTLPGASWRPLAEDDVLAYVRLHEVARIADGGAEVPTEATARHDLTDPTCPLPTNSLGLALPDGSLGASIRIQERLHGIASRRVFLWGVTHPTLRGRGIGTAILGWAVARADAILAREPAHLERLAEAFIEDRLVDAVALHEAAGFRPARWYSDMRRDLRQPIPAEPDIGGVRIELYEPVLAEQVRLAHNDAFADHWGSEPITPEVWARDLVGDPSFRSDLSLVALDGDQIVGYSANYVAESDWEAAGIREGWVGQLGVRRPWRRRGLATALLVRSMTTFAAAGLEAATLGVDTENPTGAVGVYERVGFVAIRRSVRLQRPFGDRREG
jgi:GNAT superfamily N-acetyltransferase